MSLEILILFAVAGVVIGLVLSKVSAMGSIGTSKAAKAPGAIASGTAKVSRETMVQVPQDLESRLSLLIERGDKIPAIKELRMATNFDLKRAKEIIDAMSAGTPLGKLIDLSSVGSTPSVPGNARASALASVSDARCNEEIRRLLRAGRKIEALKQLRDATGLGLKEAKDLIDEMSTDLN